MANSKNAGKGFERLAESLFNKLIENSEYESVERDVQLQGKDGLRQVDVLIRSKVASFNMLTVVECKDHNRKLSISVVDAFHSKLLDIQANKGILISRLGFSSKAISKAKRLGISLCTAHKALSPKWMPDIDIPVIIEEIQPIDINLEFTGTMEKGNLISQTSIPLINGIDVTDLVDKKWKEGTLKFDKTNRPQKLVLEELSKPYITNLSINNSGSSTSEISEISDLDIFFRVRIRYFQTSLSKLRGTEILKDITEQKLKIFLEIHSVEKLITGLKEIKKNEIAGFIGLRISLNIKPNLVDKPQKIEFQKLKSK
ncbi:restriction endonuclease [Flagellimonas sp. CMM7]|uniref:restriction endonuclease n=1 Tax=Flagellimonas sp. CMM7 TaxID=2654676 RepID=UPI0013D4141D|nr:restriction endonuclease [Flagellimonas sp. CMM7]UII80140.1 restriction endonuclease [Flagellimonas sp. CMM7]